MSYHHQSRLDRALYHLESLKEKRDAWRDENPFRTWTEHDADGTKKVLWVEVLKAPPVTQLSLIIGDCLHNLRSALDNLAFELALAHKGERLSKTMERDSGFPILPKCSDQALKNLNRNLRGVDPTAKTIIQGLQPYNRGEGFATNDPLWQLNQLNVEDKHRLPHVTLLGTASLSYWVQGFEADEIEPFFPVIQDRAPIARYPAIDNTGAEVNVQLTPNLDIAFGQRAPKQLRGTPVPARLEYIHRHIAERVLPPLVPFLD
jgi:hypothetical protein